MSPASTGVCGARDTLLSTPDSASIISRETGWAVRVPPSTTATSKAPGRGTEFRSKASLKATFTVVPPVLVAAELNWGGVVSWARAGAGQRSRARAAAAAVAASTAAPAIPKTCPVALRAFPQRPLIGVLIYIFIV